MCVRTTHEGHLVVFITVQNLVGIDAVVFDNMQVFWLENAHFRPKIGVFRGKIGKGVGRYCPPTNSFLLFGGLHVCVQFGENR